ASRSRRRFSRARHPARLEAHRPLPHHRRAMTSAPASAATTSPSVQRVSIAETFARLRQRNQIALMSFVAAGFPDVATTRAVLPAIEAAGASLIEVGFPFSDP